MERHRRLIRCDTDPETLEASVPPALEALEGAEVFEQADTMRLYGWIVRRSGRSVGVEIPGPGETPVVAVSGDDVHLVDAVVAALTATPDAPLWGHAPAP